MVYGRPQTVEFYRITICENGVVVPPQKELMKARNHTNQSVNYKHCHCEMYRQGWMMEEAFEVTD